MRYETNLFTAFVTFPILMYASAQQVQPVREPADSVKNVAYIDSLFRELPEVMITGERPVVKAEQGNWCTMFRDW